MNEFLRFLSTEDIKVVCGGIKVILGAMSITTRMKVVSLHKEDEGFLFSVDKGEGDPVTYNIIAEKIGEDVIINFNTMFNSMNQLMMSQVASFGVIDEKFYIQTWDGAKRESKFYIYENNQLTRVQLGDLEGNVETIYVSPETVLQGTSTIEADA